MNAEDAVELDQLFQELATAVLVAMENDVEWWTTTRLLVVHEAVGERSVIRYRSLGDEDRELDATAAVQRLVGACRARFERGGRGSVRSWELTVDGASGEYRLDTTTEAPAGRGHGALGGGL